jgi:diguanylate cyclase
VRPIGTSLVSVSEFGPFDAHADRAHALYIDGFSESAVLACRESALVTVSAGDRVTTQFLLYVEGIALQEVGRHHEAVTVALDLLVALVDEPDLMWRAKALALLAESSTQVKEVNRAMDALAEGTWLVANTKSGRYSHLSASMAVALALRAVYLLSRRTSCWPASGSVTTSMSTSWWCRSGRCSVPTGGRRCWWSAMSTPRVPI